MDINKHRYYMTQVLLAIFQDNELGKLLAFKGGTSMLMFHGLTRFSTDLDFNLLDKEQTEKVYHRIRSILQRFGKIEDEAIYPLLITKEYVSPFFEDIKPMIEPAKESEQSIIGRIKQFSRSTDDKFKKNFIRNLKKGLDKSCCMW